MKLSENLKIKQYRFKMRLNNLFVFSILFLGGIFFSKQQTFGSNNIWKVGVACKNITPVASVWMGGYANRVSPSEGKIHDLWAKALMIEDARGHRAILITMDLLGIPKNFSDELRNKIKQKYGLDRSQIVLSCSHTHSGPVVSRALEYIYPMNSDDWKKVDQYTERLEKMLFQLVGESMENMKYARIYTKNGVARFQVNRRNNKENQLTSTTNLCGPNDYAVPVIKVEGLDKSLIAVIFGYACHPTTLSINRFSGDYPGFAQIELEKLYPGTVAMFFQGAGADQNPLPRRTIPLAIQYGKQLAAAVESVLSDKMDNQESILTNKYNEIDLPLDNPLSMQQLQEISKENDYQARWAKGMIAEYEKKGSFIKTYPYPIQYWKIGSQSLFVMGGEVLVSYSIQLKELYGQEIFLMAYANDIVSYIPSSAVIEEGGYEGDISQRVYGLPAKWDKQIEPLIISGLKKLAYE
ncbi:neutral/alkaline non-lysosomal ceramidase N-terminal domain-containing protein [Parabacteroides sp. Marseille-P3160]|uniref:neutral/alkaline non-lysosomal ceramidase N-terminal domain-containing protein n=1 Tax=Parabacteroides sp. Marseille-P3160 TaxID=1917887 RepID=UPI00190EC087|nr:neutral/alkaline non-lysosomal ceramidase N-terminal domain-containing protein [Parabacteroides sp. Marseille-P3160]